MASGTIQTDTPINISITPSSDVIIENNSFKKVGRTYFLTVRLHSTAIKSTGSNLFTFAEPSFSVSTPLATKSEVRCDVIGGICRTLSPLNANVVLTLSGAFCI